MKTLVTLVSLVVSNIAFASDVVPSLCYRNATAAVEQYVSEIDYDYDQNGIEAFSCELANNRQAVICNVAASKGMGDAIDSYRAVLSLSCKKVYRVEMTSEE